MIVCDYGDGHAVRRTHNCWIEHLLWEQGESLYISRAVPINRHVRRVCGINGLVHHLEWTVEQPAACVCSNRVTVSAMRNTLPAVLASLVLTVATAPLVAQTRKEKPPAMDTVTVAPGIYGDGKQQIPDRLGGVHRLKSKSFTAASGDSVTVACVPCFSGVLASAVYGNEVYSLTLERQSSALAFQGARERPAKKKCTYVC
jgi:hypothetical protein